MEESEILIFSYSFNEEDKEKDTFVYRRHFEGDLLVAEVYIMLNWSAIASGTNDNISYTLSDAAFDLNASPVVQSELRKQDKLVSGTNIKTINGQDLLGEGNIEIQDKLVSGTNIKTVNGQDLLGEGNIEIQDKLVSGTNIKTVNGQDLLGEGNIEIQAGGETVTNITNVNNVFNSYSIGSATVGNSSVEKRTLFGSSVNVEGAVSNELPKISIFSKPQIEESGTDNLITFPTSFNLTIGGEGKAITNENPIRSIRFTSDKNTEVSDFTYSDDEGALYISDSVEIYNGKYYYIQRVEEKVWHTGEEEPEIYLSNKVAGLVDGATIYIPKDAESVMELGDISVSADNGNVITTDNSAYLYLQIEELVPKQIIDNPLILTKMSELTDKDGITVKGRNVAFDEDEDILYICAYSGTLYKVDVSDVRHPSVVGNLTVNETRGHVCTGCAVTNDYLYAVDRNEGQTTSPSYLTVIRKSDFTIVNQINVCDEETWYLQNGNYAWGQSPCMCAIDKRGYLFVPENQNFWDIYDIKTDPENPKLAFRQTYDTRPMDIDYREYQSVDFLNVGDKYYAFFAGWTSGVSIWDVTDVSSPSLIGQITLIPWNKRAQTMDVLVEYPYLYIPCGAALAYRFMHHPLNRSVVRFDISDLAKYSGEIDYLHNPELFTIASIPYDKFYPSITREGDPAPTRITKCGDFIAVNYAEAGTAIFRLINGVPVFQSCYQLAGKGNTVQPVYATKDGRFFQVNIYGSSNGMQIYGLGNVNY